jgi:general secretion pathway protein A
VSVRAIINPLDASEMQAYVLHRLKQVGGDERLFEPAALRAIVCHARGIPRRANILCHNALLFAFGRSLPFVTAGAAGEAIAEMDERQPGALGRGALRRVSAVRPWSWRVPVGLASAGALVLIAGSAMLLGGREGATAGPGASAAVSPPAELPTKVQAPSVPAPPADTTATAATPRSPEPPPAQVRAPEAQQPAAPTTDPVAPSVRIVNIPPGGSILAAARELYGRFPGDAETRALLSEVQRLNPGLRDVNLVKAGATVKFPGAPRQPESDEQPSE